MAIENAAFALLVVVGLLMWVLIFIGLREVIQWIPEVVGHFSL